eukprot:UN03071
MFCILYSSKFYEKSCTCEGEVEHEIIDEITNRSSDAGEIEDGMCVDGTDEFLRSSIHPDYGYTSCVDYVLENGWDTCDYAIDGSHYHVRDICCHTCGEEENDCGINALECTSGQNKFQTSIKCLQDELRIISSKITTKKCLELTGCPSTLEENR